MKLDLVVFVLKTTLTFEQVVLRSDNNISLTTDLFGGKREIECAQVWLLFGRENNDETIWKEFQKCTFKKQYPNAEKTERTNGKVRQVRDE